MPELRDVVAYICVNYPFRNDLSKAKLTKIVYLADWKSAIDHGRQMTNIQWMFNHYGPYVDDIVDLAQTDPLFDIERDTNYYGLPKEVIRIKEPVDTGSLNDEDKAVLDSVIATTAPKNWDSFIKLVYSTYPILTQPKHSTLDLVKLASEYRKVRNSFAT